MMLPQKSLTTNDLVISTTSTFQIARILREWEGLWSSITLGHDTASGGANCQWQLLI
jgi:hypothetical protein